MTDYPSFLEVKLKNRSVLASGILGVTISSLRRVYNDGAGIVTTKSVGPEKRNGHSAPVIYDWGCGLINAVGLSTPGIDEFVSRFGYGVVDFPLIVSIFGKEVDDFPLLAQKLDSLDFTFLELNISCPNVMDEFDTPFSFSAELTSQITRSVKDRTCKPVIVKLSSNTQDLVSVARSAENSGADAICIMNTVGPGMVIDISTGFPVLWNKRGGISGDAVLPLTVKNVYDVYNEVSIPIIGTGGVSSTGSALQVMMAGASLYGIGSAVYTKGLRVFKDVEEGILEFLHNNHFESSEEVIGLAHKQKKVSFYRIPKPVINEDQKRKNIKFVVSPVKELLKADEHSINTLFFEQQGLSKPAPGQFFMLWIPGLDQKPYSVSYYDENRIGFSLMARGTFSTSLLGLTCGEPVGLHGPLGKSFELQQYDNYLLVGGGIGVAPLIFSASELVKLGKGVNILAGGRTWASINWIIPLLEKIAKYSQIKTFFCTEDGSFGEQGLITDHLQGVIERVCPDFALVCGPEIFIKKALTLFKINSVPGEASIDRMMKCGLGLCGSCSLDITGDRVCVEGPVFHFDYLEKCKEFGNYKRDESGALRGID